MSQPLHAAAENDEEVRKESNTDYVLQLTSM